MAGPDRIYLFDSRSIDIFTASLHYIGSVKASGIVDFAASDSALFTVSSNLTIAAYTTNGDAVTTSTISAASDTQVLSIAAVNGAPWVSIITGCNAGNCLKKTLVFDPRAGLTQTVALDGSTVDVVASGNRAYAINRGAIIQQAYGGRATPAWGPLSPANKLYVYPNLPTSPYDLNRAQQLLAAAGYRQDPDGVLRDAQGDIVEFVLSTSLGNPDREAIGNILRQDFARLGMRVTFTPEGLDRLIGKLVVTHRWEAMIIGLAGTIEPAVTNRNVWMSAGALHMWRPEQEKPATEWEAEVDQLFERIAREVDPGKRTQLYYRWQEIVAAQVPLMFFAYPKTQTAVRKTLGNVRPGLGGAVGELATLFSKAPSR